LCQPRVPELGAADALGLTISQPDWSATVQLFKIFTFGATGHRMVRVQDSASRETTLAIPAAG
jgi:hypothetical protein